MTNAHQFESLVYDDCDDDEERVFACLPLAKDSTPIPRLEILLLLERDLNDDLLSFNSLLFSVILETAVLGRTGGVGLTLTARLTPVDGRTGLF